jgi:ribosomal-protein-alanine N-acetyltransferase
MDRGVVLDTPRLMLRAWSEADSESLHGAFGDPDSMRFWDSLPSRDVAETSLRIRQSLDANPELHCAFAITIQLTNQVVGMVNYHDRRPAQRRLAIGWILLPDQRRQGYAQEAACALIRYCFRTLGANRIEARIEPPNGASLRLADRMGFRREGLMRDWLVVDGMPRDMLMLSLLRADRPDLAHD